MDGSEGKFPAPFQSQSNLQASAGGFLGAGGVGPTPAKDLET